MEERITFVDGGAALLVSIGGSLALIDPRRRVVIDRLSLDSPSVPDRSASPEQGARLDQQLRTASWSWDAARGTIVGAVCRQGWGQVDGRLSVWMPGLWPMPTPLPGTDGSECRPLAISADASRILARTSASTAQLFAVATATTAGPPIKLAHDPQVGAIAPGGTWVATAGKTGEVALYEPSSGRLDTLAGGRNRRIDALVFDPTRAVLVVVGDVEALAWDLPARTSSPLAEHVAAAAFSPDGKRLALATDDAISLRDAATFQPTRSLAVARARSLAFSPDAALLAVETERTLEIHELAPGGAPPAIDRRWFDRLIPLPVPAPRPEPPFTRDGVLEGRITLAGRPVAGAEIRLVPRDERRRARAVPAVLTRTDARGRYRVTQLARIDWSVQWTAPGLTIDGRLADLRASREVKLDGQLQRAVTLRGRVLGPDGRPLANAHVFHPRTEVTNRVELTSSRAGMFTIDHLAVDADSGYGRGGYELQAWRPDGAVVTVKTLFKTAGPTTVTLRLLPPEDPRVLRLKVIDEQGAPVPDAAISIRGRELHPVDTQGRVTIDVDPDAVVNGQLDLQVVGAGEVVQRQVAWPAKGVMTVELRRTAPPGTLLPLACLHYREAMDRIVRCDRIPQATRDALKSELDRSAATWDAHPDRAEFDCGLAGGTARELAKLCH